VPDVFDVLSEDHGKVKEMLAQLINERPLFGADKDKLADRKKMAARLITEESRHEAVEQRFFWPAVRAKLPDGDTLADTAIGQEEEAKEILARLDRLQPGWEFKEFEELLESFAQAAREHIDYEETQVWPRMRKALGRREAAELGKKVQEGKKTASDKPKPGQVPRQRGSRPSDKKDTAGKTRAELYEQARKLGIEGRSSMSKDELARHVARSR
jgi:hemerythrin-like domain-containing protein